MLRRTTIIAVVSAIGTISGAAALARKAPATLEKCGTRHHLSNLHRSSVAAYRDLPWGSRKSGTRKIFCHLAPALQLRIGG